MTAGSNACSKCTTAHWQRDAPSDSQLCRHGVAKPTGKKKVQVRPVLNQGHRPFPQDGRQPSRVTATLLLDQDVANAAPLSPNMHLRDAQGPFRFAERIFRMGGRNTARRAALGGYDFNWQLRAYDLAEPKSLTGGTRWCANSSFRQ